jgi:hypothetical protein
MAGTMCGRTGSPSHNDSRINRYEFVVQRIDNWPPDTTRQTELIVIDDSFGIRASAMFPGSGSYPFLSSFLVSSFGKDRHWAFQVTICPGALNF